MRTVGALVWIFAIEALLIEAIVRYETKSTAPKYANPDQHGFRYCASWKLADGTPIYSGCDPYVMNRCGKELEFDYSCCSGFQHSGESLGGQSSNPCGKLVPQFDDCPSVVEGLGYPNFANYLRNIPELNQKNGQAYTIFVPRTNDANALDPIYGKHHRAAAYSVAKGRYYAEDLKSGVELESLFDGEEIAISRTSYGGVNVECIEVSQTDIECGSGLIHLVRRPLVPRKGLGNLDKSNVITLLRSNPETSSFANDLPQKLQNDLGRVETNKRYTVMAPSSRSWDNLRGRYSGERLQNIAASHVSAGLKCTSNIIKDTEDISAVDGQSVDVKCATGPRGQEVRKVVDACGQEHEFVSKSEDQMAANGVVHVLNDPIVPSSALTLKDFIDRPECARHQKIDKFMDVLRECDLYMNDAEQYAVVAPQNSAFDWWKNYPQFSDEYQRFQVDKEYRCKVARYHIVRHDGNLANIPKFSGHTDGHRTNNKNDYLYETTYFTQGKTGSVLNWHYSPVNNLDTITLKDSSIYRTSRINVPPETNISDILVARPDFSNTNEITQIAEMKSNVFDKQAPKNLYLVTADDGWLDKRSKKLGKTLLSPDLARYKSDPKVALNFGKMNTVPLYLWGGDIGYFEKNSVNRFMSTVGKELIFWMDDKGDMRIGYDGLDKKDWARVVEFNIPARDGIIWVLDGYLPCPGDICAMILEDTDTYTFYTAACIAGDLPGEENPKKAFADKPTEIAKRHPDKCIVVKQGSVQTVKDVFESGPVAPHDH